MPTVITKGNRIFVKGRQVLGKSGTSSGGGGGPDLSGITIFGITSGATLSLADNAANGTVLGTLGITAVTGTPTGTGTWTLSATGGFTKVALSSSTGLTVNVIASSMPATPGVTSTITVNYSEAGVSAAPPLSFNVNVFDHAGLVQVGAFELVNRGSSVTNPWITESGMTFESALVPSTHTLVVKDPTNAVVTCGHPRATYPDGSLYWCGFIFQHTGTLATDARAAYTVWKTPGSFNDTTSLTVSSIPNFTLEAVVAGSTSANNGTWTVTATRAKGGNEYNPTTGYGSAAADSPTRGMDLMSSSPVHTWRHLWSCFQSAGAASHRWLRGDLWVLSLSDGTTLVDAAAGHPYYNGPNINATAGDASLTAGGRARAIGFHATAYPSGNLTLTLRDSASTAHVTKANLVLNQGDYLAVADTDALPMVLNASGVKQTHHQVLFYCPATKFANTTIPAFWSGPTAYSQYLASLSSYTTATNYTIGYAGESLHGDDEGRPQDIGDIECVLNWTSQWTCMVLGDLARFRKCMRVSGIGQIYAPDTLIDPRTGCFLDTTLTNSYTHAAVRIGTYIDERRDDWLLADNTGGDYVRYSDWTKPPGGDPTHQQQAWIYPYMTEGRPIYLFGQAAYAGMATTGLRKVDFNVSGTHYRIFRYILHPSGGIRAGLWPFFSCWHLANICPVTSPWRGTAEFWTRHTLQGLAAMCTTNVTDIDGATNTRVIGHTLVNMNGAWMGIMNISPDPGDTHLGLFDTYYPNLVFPRISQSNGIGSADAATLVNSYLKNEQIGQATSTHPYYVADAVTWLVYNSDSLTPRFTSWDTMIVGQVNYDALHQSPPKLCNWHGLYSGNDTLYGADITASVQGHAQMHLAGLIELANTGFTTTTIATNQRALYSGTLPNDFAQGGFPGGIFNRFAIRLLSEYQL